jgi:hypothetical protein
MHASTWGRARWRREGAPPGATRLVRAGPGTATALLIAWICATHGAEVLDAIASCPPWVLAAATLAHAFTLLLRTEAWRTVLLAACGQRLDQGALHAANAGSFLVGTVQNQAALPARIALLRRFGGDGVPEVSQIALADVPILALEVCTSAVLAGVASLAIRSIPRWTPIALMAGGLTVLVLLRAAHLRFRHRSLTGSLAVLASSGPCARLIAIVAAFTVAALARTWVVLIGFGLPSGPADTALLLFSMGAIGLLPLGSVGTAPAATIAAMGASGLATAAAAGLAIGASTVLAALLYAGACWMCGARLTPAAMEAEAVSADLIPLPARQGREPEPELDLAA